MKEPAMSDQKKWNYINDRKLSLRKYASPIEQLLSVIAKIIHKEICETTRTRGSYTKHIKS